MSKTHEYQTLVEWTGNEGSGTTDYRSYNRNHRIICEGKAAISGSSDPAFRGDASRHNPEELLVASIASCHMLWFLHLCSQAGVVVTAYEDGATGFMKETADGSGHFTGVTLRPRVTILEKSMEAKVNDLHHQAGKLCFIANSCNFPVRHEAITLIEEHPYT